MSGALDAQLEALGVKVAHHFVGGLYAKETHIPAGIELVQHLHSFDHLAALMSGSVVVSVDGRETAYAAPALIQIRAGAAHAVRALTDVAWACLHRTDVTDPDKIDAELIA